ncbi:C40 family peptidase [Oscillospiraceae bacterium OttesenSCG-928-G22]|nr:C40 family peptidase [Oscillospiraceae bacterium OttesenSCG-928-G22]
MHIFKKPVRFVLLSALLLSLLIGSAAAVDLMLGTVNASALKFREAASSSAKVYRVVPRDTKVVVLEKLEGWYKVSLGGTTGYMSAEYLDVADKADIELTGVVTPDILNVRSEPSLESASLAQLKKGEKVEITGIESGFYRISFEGKSAYLHPAYIELTAPSASADRDSLIAFAKQYIGTPYRYGGSAPGGFDCSGFVYYVFKSAGHTLPRGASSMMDKVPSISRSELLPGDLVFFNDGSARRASHVGIYVGGNQFIHAVKPGQSLTISTMASGYYANTYCGSGRILD